MRIVLDVTLKDGVVASEALAERFFDDVMLLMDFDTGMEGDDEPLGYVDSVDGYELLRDD